MSVELTRAEKLAFENYSNRAQVVRDLERDLSRCVGLTIGGEPAFKVLAPRLEQARLAQADAYASWQRAKAAAPTSSPVRIIPKHTPVTLPRPAAPQITPAQRAAMHAVQDAVAWKLFGK